MSDQQSWPSQDVLARVAAGFNGLREDLRARAHALSGDENRPQRQNFLDACFLVDEWSDRTLAKLSEPTALEHPELADEPPTEWPLVNSVRDTWPVSPANRTANDPSFRWTPQPGMHRSSP